MTDLRILALPDRLASRISIDPATLCWAWTGGRTAAGYGQIAWNGQRLGVHRIMYEQFTGALLSQHEIHHTCENPACCNPDHLQQLTKVEHVSVTPHWVSQRPHCKNGHEYTEENTRYDKTPTGYARRCLTCQSEKSARRRKTTPGNSSLDWHRADTCKRGHDLTKHAYTTGRRGRACGECMRQRSRQQRKGS